MSLDGALKLLAAPKEEDAEPAESLAEPRGSERPFWSLRETNKRMRKRLDIMACMGGLLSWAVEKGVKQEHKLFRWLCPAEGWMNEERAWDLKITLFTKDAPGHLFR